MLNKYDKYSIRAVEACIQKKESVEFMILVCLPLSILTNIRILPSGNCEQLIRLTFYLCPNLTATYYDDRIMLCRLMIGCNKLLLHSNR